MKKNALLIFASVLLVAMTSPALADIVAAGDTIPLSSDTFWWSNGGDPGFPAYVGGNETGSLTIDSGSVLASSLGHVGLNEGSFGSVSVEGEGSAWAVTDAIYCGILGRGTLNVTGGGTISAGGDVFIGSNSKATMLVRGSDPMLEVGGNLVNNGTVRIMAEPKTEPGTSAPLAIAGSTLGDGALFAYGGTWNESARTFRVAEATPVATGAQDIALNVDLASGPRFDLSRLAVGTRAGVSFPQGVGSFDFSVADLHDLRGLGARLHNDQSVLAGLDFNAELPSGVDAMVSFEIGNACRLDELDIWSYAPDGSDGNLWKAVQPEGLLYSDGWVHFTAEQLQSYAVSGPSAALVPGDANRDRKVDGSDVTILAGNWQAGVDSTIFASRSMGDFNGDGKVDGSDVTILAGNWQYGVSAAAASVPEPSIAVLILALVAGFCVSRRR